MCLTHVRVHMNTQTHTLTHTLVLQVKESHIGTIEERERFVQQQIEDVVLRNEKVCVLINLFVCLDMHVGQGDDGHRGRHGMYASM